MNWARLNPFRFVGWFVGPPSFVDDPPPHPNVCRTFGYDRTIYIKALVDPLTLPFAALLI